MIKKLTPRVQTINNEERQRSTDIYVKNMFKYIDKWEIISIYYNRDSNKQYVNKDTINKTFSSNDDIIDDNRLLIYEMLMYADTIHDFKNIEEFDEEEFYIEKRHLFPIDMTLEILLNEQLFIEYVSTRKNLEFVSKTVDNPLYDFCIHIYDIRKDEMNYRELSNYIQILKLINYIKKCFNYDDDTFDFHFQIDGNNTKTTQLIDIIVDLSFMNKSLHKYFSLNTELNDYIHHMNLDRDKNKWVITKSDSNFLNTDELYKEIDDEEEVYNQQLSIDSRPTGNIYKPGYNFQISLNGVIYHNDKPYVKCTIIGKDSRNNLEKRMNIDVDDNCSNRNFCTFSIYLFSVLGYSDKEDNIKIPSISLLKFDRDTLYAIKRAGDWGQVEHAKKYKKIFVTDDIMAALYAYFRDVPCILLREAPSHHFKNILI